MAHLLSCETERVLSERTASIRRKINPLFKLVGPLFLEHRQVIESKNTLLGIDAEDEPMILPEESVIWCPNHSFMEDALASVLVCRHSYILFGSLPDYYNTFDGITAFINGVVMCNRKVPASRHASMQHAKRLLRMGTDLILYPEGVWNKTPEKLILDLWPGIYRIASEMGKKIIPVIHYLRDPHKKYKENVIHTVVADPISVEGLNEKEALELLRDTMATWHFLLMERYGRASREEALEGHHSADEAWDSYISMHTGCVEYYDREIELKGDYRPKTVVRPADVWSPIAEIRDVNAKNIRHIRYAQELVRRERYRDFQRRY